MHDIWSWLSRWTLDWSGTRTNWDGQIAIPTVLVINCPHGSIRFPWSRRSAQSLGPYFDSCSISHRRLDFCISNRSDRDRFGRGNPADWRCYANLPQCLPCTQVSMWGYCPIRRPSSTFMPLQCFPDFPDTRTSATSWKDSFSPLAITPFSNQLATMAEDDGRRPDWVTSFSFKGWKAVLTLSQPTAYAQPFWTPVRRQSRPRTLRDENILNLMQSSSCSNSWWNIRWHRFSRMLHFNRHRPPHFDGHQWSTPDV